MERIDIKHVLDRKAALRFIRTVKAHNGTLMKGSTAFGIHGRCFLPTTEGRGFDSGALLSVSRKAAVEYVKNALSEALAGRGAKIEIHELRSVYSDGREHVHIFI